MKEMRVLYVLANCSFPPSEGAHEQSIGLIKSISESGAKCAIITGFKEVATFDIEGFKRFAPLVEVRAAMPCKGSYTARLFMNSLVNFLHRKLRLPLALFPKFFLQDYELLEAAASVEHSYNLVHVEGIPFVPLVSQILQTEHRIVSIIDAWSLRQKRLFSSSKGALRKIARAASWAVASIVDVKFLKKEGRVHVVSPVDSEYLNSRGIKGGFSIPIMLGPTALPSPAGNVNRAGIYIYGDLRVPYIHEGVSNLLESLIQTPGVDGGRVNVLGRRQATSDLILLANKLERSVNFVSWIDDVDSVLRSAEFILLPDAAGTGLKNRSIAALASGAVVIGTAAAFEGIDAKDRINSVIYEKSSDAWVALVGLQNLADSKRLIGEAGRLLAITNYSPCVITRRWLEIYRLNARGCL